MQSTTITSTLSDADESNGVPHKPLTIPCIPSQCIIHWGLIQKLMCCTRPVHSSLRSSSTACVNRFKSKYPMMPCRHAYATSSMCKCDRHSRLTARRAQQAPVYARHAMRRHTRYSSLRENTPCIARCALYAVYRLLREVSLVTRGITRGEVVTRLIAGSTQGIAC